jgi:hypothetical protein
MDVQIRDIAAGGGKGYVYHCFFCLFVCLTVLGIELRVLWFRQALYHLNHTPFAFYGFLLPFFFFRSDSILHFCLGWP